MASSFSFALKVKEEIATLPFDDASLRPLLSAFLKCNGSIRLGERVLDLCTESSKIAKLLYHGLSSIYGIPVRFAYSKQMRLRKAVQFHVLCPEVDYILSDLEVDLLSPSLPKSLLANERDEQSYLAGAFLAKGSVNDPHSSNYHLEIACEDEAYAKGIAKLINKSRSFPFNAKVARRRNQFIAYLKRSEQISAFLTYIGATASCLEFENIRIDRDFSNVGNRFNNLDAANMEKTVSAASRQLKEIAFFKKGNAFPEIYSEKLKALMRIREANPDASLAELASLLSEELSCQISKSNINHLFRKLHEEYQIKHGIDQSEDHEG